MSHPYHKIWMIVFVLMMGFLQVEKGAHGYPMQSSTGMEISGPANAPPDGVGNMAGCDN